MDTQNTLAHIEALPLPNEMRQQILEVARRLTQPQQEALLQQLSARLAEFAETSLAMQEAVLSDFDASVQDVQQELRAMGKQEETAQRSSELDAAEAQLQQSA